MHITIIQGMNMKKITIILFGFYLLGITAAQSCTMFRLTMNGKTFIGNNEDFSCPYTRFWVEPGDENSYGVIFFGFDNGFPQGGMNEKGLVVDGFSTPELPVQNTQGKKPFNGILMEEVLKCCSTVEEVENLIIQYDLSHLSSAQLMFADIKGHSIIVEGDEIIHSTDTFQICTNFYQSQITDESNIICQRYKTARRLLSGNPEPTIKFCTAILDSVHSERPYNKTQYSNIYDPAQGVVYLYLFHNFDEVVKIDLQQELSEGKHVTELADLFQNNELYLTYRTHYTEAEKLSNQLLMERDPEKIQQIVGTLSNNEQAKIFYGSIARKADLLLNQNKYERAMELFRLGALLFPNSWHSWLKLGGVSYASGDYTMAVNYFKKAISINPDSPDTWHGWRKLGDACLQSGDKEAAIASYEKAARINPENMDLQNRLKEIKKSE